MYNAFKNNKFAVIIGALFVLIFLVIWIFNIITTDRGTNPNLVNNTTPQSSAESATIDNNIVNYTQTPGSPNTNDSETSSNKVVIDSINSNSTATYEEYLEITEKLQEEGIIDEQTLVHPTGEMLREWRGETEILENY